MEKIEIIYQDQNMAVISKSSGLAVLPHPKLPQENVYELLKSQFKKVFMIHSIDKDASGVLICAKNQKTREFISGQFKELKVERFFLVLLSGVLECDEGEIAESILISKKGIKIDKFGKKAITKYKIIEKFKDFTLARVCPVTQIPSQIRLHFWSIGHPLAIDGKYYSKEPLMLSSFKRKYKQKKDAKEKPLIERLTLHLESLNLQTEEKGEKKKFVCPLPKDFEIALKMLRKYDL